MRIVPTYCALSYAYNDRVEFEIASYLARITGTTLQNIGGGKRTEFDFELCTTIENVVYPVQFELKTTGGKPIPVEVYKDQEKTIPSGLNASTAPLVVTLSLGKRTGYVGDVGKLRVFKRTTLLQEAVRERHGFFFQGATPSQSAYRYSATPQNINHIWLGDVPVEYIRVTNHVLSDKQEYVTGYMFDAIIDDNANGAEQLREWIKHYQGLDEDE